MDRKSLLALWGIGFILCAGLGFIPEAAGALRVLLTAASVLFFLPPAVLLYRGEERVLIRWLSALSLGLTLVLLVLSVATAAAPAALGMALHCLLTIVSAPMLCSGYWALSLFLWACLLIGSFQKK